MDVLLGTFNLSIEVKVKRIIRLLILLKNNNSKKLVSLQKALFFGLYSIRLHRIFKAAQCCKKCPFNQITLGDRPKLRLKCSACGFSTAYTKPAPWK